MTDQDLHIIELYLNDKLSGAEKVEFEHRLKSDAEFRTTVGQMRASIMGIRQAAIEEKLALLKEEEARLTEQNVSTFKIQPMYRWVALAAVLIGAFILLKPLMKPDDTIRNAYLAEHFDEYVLHETTRSGNDSEKKVTREQETAYNFYRMKQFHKAMPLLEELWEEKRDTQALFYLLVSKSALGEYPDTVIKFENSKLDSLVNLIQINSE